MSEFCPLNLYAVKNDSNIIADITYYQDNNICLSWNHCKK